MMSWTCHPLYAAEIRFVKDLVGTWMSASHGTGLFSTRLLVLDRLQSVASGS